MTVHEQISRINSDIGRLQEKVKIYQGKISQLSERKKKLPKNKKRNRQQERADSVKNSNREKTAETSTTSWQEQLNT